MNRSSSTQMILQPDAGVGFAVVFGDVARRSKASWKMSVAHGASEYFGTRPFKNEAASLMIIAASTLRVPCVWLGLCAIIPWVMPPLCLRFRLSTRLDRAVAGREGLY
jgi:hypothetical protein